MSAGAYSLTCPRCGEASPVPDDPAGSVYRCDCGCRIAYGNAMPRMTLMPHPADRRFYALRAEWYGERAGDVTFSLDQELVLTLALEILSVADPAAFRLLRAAHARRARGEPLSAPAADGVPLDAPPPLLGVSPASGTRVPLPPVPPAAEAAARALAGPEPPPAAGPGLCACGNRAVLANGACLSCALGQIGGHPPA